MQAKQIDFSKGNIGEAPLLVLLSGMFEILLDIVTIRCRISNSRYYHDYHYSQI